MGGGEGDIDSSWIPMLDAAAPNQVVNDPHINFAAVADKLRAISDSHCASFI